MMHDKSLIRKYNVPVPRYTSYPTVPVWENPNDLQALWPSIVKRTFDESNARNGVSLYIHLPFCESLCTYCGCFQHITVNHNVEGRYIQALLREWRHYLDIFQATPYIRELHLGGGTPTFFSPDNLNKLLSGILSSSTTTSEKGFSFEGHPNNTTFEHLKILYEHGFRRVSFGVQDFDIKIQQAINRIQPYKNVERVTMQARNIGYDSVNFDLVYGLPFQTLDIIRNTFEKVLCLRPDRIAYYSYAHVPWKRPGQRRYTESDLPDHEEKRMLYETGKQMLLNAGYSAIGMDHFALPSDSLTQAFKSGAMRRNFMGYTVSNTPLLVGLGASAISDARYAYAQNIKNVKKYQEAVEQNEATIVNGHILTREDLQIRKFIANLICHGQVKGMDRLLALIPEVARGKLLEMISEQLVQIEGDTFRVTEKGQPFIRNICQIFDRHHWTKHNEGPRYSKAI